ncbi:MAG: division/cell wall cluster transcriptional repressor MraZ [Clostridia bacterium]|nr:division/cell wall cluster transcriptional repressor MraZ [Clostridia bacterium]
MMFTGMSFPNLDSKGRVVLPQKFREQLGETFYITAGFDNDFPCVQIMSAEQFEHLLSQIRELPASKALKLQYSIIAPSEEVSVNAQGRLQIPQALRESANLTKELAILGMDKRIEIWDKATYDAFMKKQREESYLDALELLRL